MPVELGRIACKLQEKRAFLSPGDHTVSRAEDAAPRDQPDGTDFARDGCVPMPAKRGS
jgi:hypothetical protein